MKNKIFPNTIKIIVFWLHLFSKVEVNYKNIFLILKVISIKKIQIISNIKSYLKLMKNFKIKNPNFKLLILYKIIYRNNIWYNLIINYNNQRKLFLNQILDKLLIHLVISRMLKIEDHMQFIIKCNLIINFI